MMPRTQRRGVKTAKKLKKKQKELLSVQEIMEAADQAFQSSGDPTHAVSLYTAAMAAPNCSIAETIECYEKRAEVLVSMSEQEKALQDYKAALKLLTEQGQLESADAMEHAASLYLYVGQLSAENEALVSFKSGVELSRKAVSARSKFVETCDPNLMETTSEDGSKTLIETRKQLAQALCAVAELYMTDLCYEEDAEQQCEAHLDEALKLKDASGEPIVDVLQTMASLRLSQRRGIEAAQFIIQAYEKMRAGCQALASLVGLRDEDGGHDKGARELVAIEEAQNLPGFEFRCQTAKILLESRYALSEGPAEDHNKYAQAAVDVLGSLMSENDEVVETWFLLGEAFAAFDPPNRDASIQYWSAAREMLLKVKKELRRELDELGEQDADNIECELDEISDQLEEISNRLEKFGASDGDASDAMEEGE